jgi:hypothetical protein
MLLLKTGRVRVSLYRHYAAARRGPGPDGRGVTARLAEEIRKLCWVQADATVSIRSSDRGPVE